VPKPVGSGLGDPDPQLTWVFRREHRLEDLRRRHEAGDPFALHHAFIFCATHSDLDNPSDPFPQWMVDKLAEELRQKMRASKEGLRHIASQQHELRKLRRWIRFLAVHCFLEQKKRPNEAIRLAAKKLGDKFHTVRNDHLAYRREHPGPVETTLTVDDLVTLSRRLELKVARNR